MRTSALIDWKFDGQGWNGEGTRPAWIGQVVGAESNNLRVIVKRTFTHQSSRKLGKRGDRTVAYQNAIKVVVRPQEEFAIVEIEYDPHFNLDAPRFTATYEELLEIAEVESEARAYLRAITVAEEISKENLTD